MTTTTGRPARVTGVIVGVCVLLVAIAASFLVGRTLAARPSSAGGEDGAVGTTAAPTTVAVLEPELQAVDALELLAYRRGGNLRPAPSFVTETMHRQLGKGRPELAGLFEGETKGAIGTYEDAELGLRLDAAMVSSPDRGAAGRVMARLAGAQRSEVIDVDTPPGLEDLLVFAFKDEDEGDDNELLWKTTAVGRVDRHLIFIMLGGRNDAADMEQIIPIVSQGFGILRGR